MFVFFIVFNKSKVRGLLLWIIKRSNINWVVIPKIFAMNEKSSALNAVIFFNALKKYIVHELILDLSEIQINLVKEIWTAVCLIREIG